MFNLIAQAAPDVSLTPLASNSSLGAIAIVISLIISGAGMWRSWATDHRAAKKSDIDTVIENYRLLLSEAKSRETKLESLVAEQKAVIERLERTIDEQRITIHRLEMANSDLERELAQYRRT